MVQTVKIKLLPTKEQKRQLARLLSEYILAVNNMVSCMVQAGKMLKLSSKDVQGPMPSAVKNQVIRDAKSVYTKYKKSGKVPVLKKPVCIWNNQNYKVKHNAIEFPIFVGGKTKRISVKAVITDYQRNLLVNKTGALRITQKSGKWIAQISITVPEPEQKQSGRAMGVDLGLKVPAVAVTEAGKIKFLAMADKTSTLKENIDLNANSRDKLRNLMPSENLKIKNKDG